MIMITVILEQKEKRVLNHIKEQSQYCIQYLNTNILPISFLSAWSFCSGVWMKRVLSTCVAWEEMCFHSVWQAAWCRGNNMWQQSWAGLEDAATMRCSAGPSHRLPACIYITAFLCHIITSVSNTLTNCPDSAWTHSGSMWSVLALTTSGSSDLIFWEMYLRLSRHTGKISCGHTRMKGKKKRRDVIREMMEYLVRRHMSDRLRLLTTTRLNATVPLRHDLALTLFEWSHKNTPKGWLWY